MGCVSLRSGTREGVPQESGRARGTYRGRTEVPLCSHGAPTVFPAPNSMRCHAPPPRRRLKPPPVFFLSFHKWLSAAINRSSIIRHDSEARNRYRPLARCTPLGQCAYYFFSVSAMSFCNLSYFAQFMCFFINSLSTAANVLLCTDNSFCMFTK